MARFFFLSGASSGFLAVALGAFGAHALKVRVSAIDLEIFKTAALYQLLHSVVLLFLGSFSASHPSPLLKIAGSSFVFGVVVFSGSLYFLVLCQARWLGAFTPIGGVSLLVGWGLLFAFFARSGA
jgi:uncharacterized membrane protein YgdD (TMEM256/DUF423 family)